VARAVIPVRGNASAGVTGIQTGGARRRRRSQRGGSYNRPSEYFGVNSGQYVDYTDPSLTPRAHDPTVARAVIPVRGNASAGVTGIQTGGARRRRRSRRRTRSCRGGGPHVLMQEHWKKILNKLTSSNGHVKCHQCKHEIDKEAFTYKNSINPANMFGNTSSGDSVDVYNYKLPSAHRLHSMKFTYIQPTIFYFACPKCAFLHQYKSSLKDEDKDSG
jgi:hypothetical protein